MKTRDILTLVLLTLLLVPIGGCGGGSSVEPEPAPDNGGQGGTPTEEEIITPAAGTTVYGVVTSDGVPLEGVRVSDGFLFARTDEKGIYQLASAKKHGYVFVILPSGHMPELKGNIPQFFVQLKEAASKCERADFALHSDPGQENSRILFLGDMQLARRSDDLGQFRHFTNEIATYIREHSAKNLYAITLGDMSWDSHWISGNYNLTNYLTDMARCGALPVFHAMGNHDHELEAEGDFKTAVKFKQIIGPTYYSLNIGSVHYVILDNIECTNDGTAQKASYNDNLVSEQLNWLRSDLAPLTADVPVVVVMHAPLYKESGKNSLDNASDVIAVLKRFDYVLLQTGHTHIMYNVDRLSSDHIMEQNSGSICATWWYTGYDVPWLHIGRDGSPGGYRVCDISGRDIKWYFKGIERPADFQFRSYDRNEILITADKYVPNANATYREEFTQTLGEYASANNDNWIYLNIWDWDPSWTVEMTENGNKLDVTRFDGYDPLHIIAYNAQRANINKSLSFPTKQTGHLFKARASSPSSTVEIIVTDRFGRVYTESMTRPKPFTLEEYM